MYTFKSAKGYYVNFYETLERISMTAMIQHYGEFEWDLDEFYYICAFEFHKK